MYDEYNYLLVVILDDEEVIDVPYNDETEVIEDFDKLVSNIINKDEHIIYVYIYDYNKDAKIKEYNNYLDKC